MADVAEYAGVLAFGIGLVFVLLLGEIDLREDESTPSRLVLDLVALEAIPDAAPVLRYAHSIVLERGDWNGRVLSVRRDDIRALCSMLLVDERELLEVAFHTGRVYHYLDVPPEVFEELIAADSVGGYFNEQIRKSYPAVRVRRR